MSYKNQDLQNRLQLGEAWSELINKISHDMATPICMLGMTHSSLMETVPKLLEAYQVALTHNLVDELDENELRLVSEAGLLGLENSLDKIRTLTNLLWPWNKEILKLPEELPLTELTTCIETAMNELPDEKMFVEVNCNPSFSVHANPTLLKKTMSFLITTAMLHIDITDNENNKLTFSSSEEDNYYKLQLNYFAPKLTESHLRHLKGSFFVKKENEIHEGFAFFRLMLLQLGGDMLYQLDSDHLMKFEIHFLKPNEDK